MKKLIVLAALIVASVGANAATFKWNAANIYASDGTSKYTGTVSLYAVGMTDALSTVTASAAGAVALTEFSSDAFTAGESYDFYFVIEDNGKQFTSATKNGVASDVGFTQLSFGNMATQTKNASNWAAVPEPTSGLLLLLGVAGLTLKRKRA